MTILQRMTRGAMAALAATTFAACSNAGTLGSVLGSVLGAGQNQLSGVVTGVDTRAQTVSIQQSNGQTVAVSYDNQTRVIYNNQQYAVTSLERGDEVTAELQSNGAQGYYTNQITVTRPASNAGGSTGGATGGNTNVQLLQGMVRQVDVNNGWFSLEMSGYGVVTVSMPYNASNADRSRFQSLRSGDNVRFYGVWLNNTRVELRQFY